MIVYAAFLDAALVMIGGSFLFIAWRLPSLSAQAWARRILLCVWILAFVPMLFDRGDWVHLFWSAQVPLLSTFVLSGALLISVWPEASTAPTPHRFNSAWLFLAMVVTLAVAPIFLIELFRAPEGRSIGAPITRTLELALWGLGGPQPEWSSPEGIPREVTVPTATLMIAAWLWIAFSALALIGSAIPPSRIRHGFLLLSPILVGGILPFFLSIGFLAEVLTDSSLVFVPNVPFDFLLFMSDARHSAVWNHDPAVLKTLGPVLVAALLSAILLAIALQWSRRGARG